MEKARVKWGNSGLVIDQVTCHVMQQNMLTLTLPNFEQFLQLQLGEFCLTAHAVMLGGHRCNIMMSPQA